MKRYSAVIHNTYHSPILLCVHDFHSVFQWNNREVQPHLATLRFEEGLMLCKLRCMIYAPLSQTHGNAASVLCFLQRHSEAVGAYILLCRILCTVTCLCVAEACLRGKHSTLPHAAQTCFGAHIPSKSYKAKTFYQSQLSGDETAFPVVPSGVF